MRARRLLSRLHSWIGAAVALFLVLVCVSGAALAFDAELFRWQYPYLETPDPAASRTADPNVGAMLESARAGYGRPFEPMGLFLPDSRVEVPAAMFFGLRPGGTGLEDTVMIAVDPATGAYRGDFILDDAWGHQLIHFHQELFAGELGGWFVAVLGLLLAAFALTGLYLWWPRYGPLWRKLRPPHLGGRPIGLWYRVHSWVGVWTAIPVVLFALTGTAVARPHWFGGLLAKLPYDVPAPLAPAFAKTCAGAVTPDQAVAAARAALPGRRLATIGFAHDGEPYRLTFKDVSPLDQVEGDTVAFVHATCPGVVRTASASGPTSALGQLMFSLHSGRSFGPLLGDVLVLLAGLASALLAGSGLYVWIARHFTRRRQRRAAARAWVAYPAE